MPILLSSQKAIGTLVSVQVSHRVKDSTHGNTQRLHEHPRWRAVFTKDSSAHSTGRQWVWAAARAGAWVPH